jgi:hypothetical protein
MARAAIVLSILISSPSDVEAECATVRSAVYDWNSTHSQDIGIVLEPIQWQTHAYPESGDRPQALINKQVVDQADMVIAVFGHRVGTPTGAAESGTIEEIERLRKRGKRVAVYFSTAPIPHDHDPEQFRRVNEYRQSLEPNTLYWKFESAEELYRLVSQHLARSVSQLYQNLQSSGTIKVLGSQLPGVVRASDVGTPAPGVDEQSAVPFSLQHVFVGEFPDGPALRLTANAPFRLTQVEYLDENGARVASETTPYAKQDLRLVPEKGYQLEVVVNHGRLIQIHNVKPRSGHEVIPMQIRVHLAVGEREVVRTIPTLLQPSFKSIKNTSTYFMKVVG